MRYALVIVFDLLVACAAAVIWWRYVPLEDGSYTVANDRIAWRIEVSNGVLATTMIENLGTGERLALAGDDFVLRVGSASAIGWGNDFQKPGESYPPLIVRDAVLVTPSRCRPQMLVRGWRTWRFILYEPWLNCTVELAFEAKRGAPWLHRRLRLASCATNVLLAIDGAVQARWQAGATPGLGGLGQPLFLDDTWFLALEHPCALNLFTNGCVLLQQFPGTRFGADGVELEPLVVGTAAKGAVRDVATRYVRSIALPLRPLTLYNTWCDLRADELTTSNVTAATVQLAEQLRKQGAKLDVIAVDDGWFIPKSIWECDRAKFPGGFADLARIARACGSQPGIWLPLSGHSLDTAWGGGRGYEVASTKYYCMTGSNYNNSLREQLCTVIQQGEIAYFKHDFNFFWCGRTDHGHFPSKEQSTEANVDVLFSLLDMERRAKPGIFLAATTGTWPSPWWLAHADCIWMGGSDHDFDRTQPCSRPSVFEMNYRDGALFSLLVEQGLLFPLPALMTHGVVDARHTPYDVRQEDDEGWANYVMNYLGRGTMMRELYLTPANLTQKRWTILGRGLAWAHSLDAAMAAAHFILGNPRKGELFGYAGDADGLRYASLRNPGLASAATSMAAIGLSGSVGEIVYPWHEWVAAGTGSVVEVPGEAVLQAMACAPARPVPLGVHALMLTGTATMTEYEIQVAPGMSKFTVSSPVRIKGVEGAGIGGITGNADHVAEVALRGQVATAAFAVSRATVSSNGVMECCAVVEGAVRARLRLVIRGGGPATPMVLINAGAVPVECVSGDGWRLFNVPLEPGTNNVRVGWKGAGAATVQMFAAREVFGRPVTLRITHAAVPGSNAEPRPVPILQDTYRYSMAVTKATAVTLSDQSMDIKQSRAVTREQIATAVRAWLTYDVFDANGGEFAGKRLSVNGEFIGLLATNTATMTSWCPAETELPAEAVHCLKLDNSLSVKDATRDCYKVRNFRLVVELPDGRQVQTDQDPMTYCSNMTWAHKEGMALPLDGTKATLLSF